MNLMLICALLYINFISKNLPFAAEVVYTNISSDVCLICKINDLPNEITWIGPDKMVIAVGFMVLGPPYSLNGTRTSSLCIKNITESYFGFYHCYGKSITVREEYEIKLQKYPTNMIIANKETFGTITISENEELVLNCSITQGDPNGVLQWTRGSETIVWNRTDNLQLLLKPTIIDNGSLYTCEALNGNGKLVVAENVTLNVYALPAMPTNVQFIGYDTMILMKWHPGQTTSEALQTYTVRYKRLQEPQWNETCCINSTHTYIIDLVPDTVYFVQLYGVNLAGGIGRKTMEYIIQTDKSPEPKPSNGLLLPIIIIGCVGGISTLVLFIKAVLEANRYCDTSKKRRIPNQEMMTSTLQTRTTTHYDEVHNILMLPLAQRIQFDSLHGQDERQITRQILGSSQNPILPFERHTRDIMMHDSSGYMTPFKIESNQMEERQRATSSSDESETIVKSDGKYESLGSRHVSVRIYSDIKSTPSTSMHDNT